MNDSRGTVSFGHKLGLKEAEIKKSLPIINIAVGGNVIFLYGSVMREQVDQEDETKGRTLWFFLDGEGEAEHDKAEVI